MLSPEGQAKVADAWLMPGLVDAHCHVGLESHGAVSEERAEEHALTDREVGTLLIRDAGAYSYGMWSRYNSRQMPRVLGLRQGRFSVLREREELSASLLQLSLQHLVGVAGQLWSCRAAHEDEGTAEPVVAEITPAAIDGGNLHQAMIETT